MELESTIHYLGERLGKVISEQESPELLTIAERIRTDANAYRAGDPTGAEAAALREVVQPNHILQLMHCAVRIELIQTGFDAN